MDFSPKESGNTCVKSDDVHSKDSALNTGKISSKEWRSTELAMPMPNKVNSSLIQRFNKKCHVKHALNIQKDVMETRAMQYKGHDHKNVAEQLFQIN